MNLFTTPKIVRINKFQVDINNPSRRFFGGGGSDVEVVDPYAGTGYRPLMKKLSGFLRPQIGQGITPYQGQRVADISPLQQMGFDVAGGINPVAESALQQGGSVLSYFDPSMATDFLGQAGGALENFTGDYDPSAVQDLYQQSFVNPAVQTFEQDIMPAIMERFAGANAADSGAMNKTLARAGRDLSTQLSGQLGDLLYRDRQDFMGRQQQAVNQAGMLAGLPGQIASQGLNIAGRGGDLASQLFNIGSAQRNIDQQNITANQQKWLEGQGYNNPWLTNFLPIAASQQPNQVVASGQASGTMDQLLPGLGSFAGSEAGSDLLMSAGTAALGFLGGL